jgi:hypothetical protein
LCLVDRCQFLESFFNVRWSFVPVFSGVKLNFQRWDNHNDLEAGLPKSAGSQTSPPLRW